MEKYRQKILLLEVQLREMARRHVLKPSLLEKKEEELRNLKILLAKIEQNPLASENFRLPSSSLQEGDIIRSHWREKGDILRLLGNEVRRIRNWVDELLLGRGHWKIVFRLSRLKTLLGGLEASQNKLNHDRRESEKFFRALHQLFHRFLPSKKNMSLASLLSELDKLNTQILKLRTQIQNERDEIRTQKAWLKQEKEKFEVEQFKTHDRHRLGAWKDLAF